MPVSRQLMGDGQNTEPKEIFEMSFAFNEAYYLQSKLAQLVSSDAATYGNWTTAQVKTAIQNLSLIHI